MNVKHQIRIIEKSSGGVCHSLDVQKMVGDCSAWNVGGLYGSGLYANDDTRVLLVQALLILVCDQDYAENNNDEGYNKIVFTCGQIATHYTEFVEAFHAVCPAKRHDLVLPSWRGYDYKLVALSFPKLVESHNYDFAAGILEQYDVYYENKPVNLAHELDVMLQGTEDELANDEYDDEDGEW